AFLFAASLMLQSCFLREQTSDTLSALRLSVSDPFAIFLAKLAANTLFLLLTELLLLPVFAVMYNVAVLPTLHWLVLVFFLGSLGVSIAGTALSAISAQARMRELLLPLLLLPLLTPILVASTEVTAALFDRSPYVQWKGVGFLAVLTGSIWAHPVWGIWWTWDARLTSTFVLWLLYVSYLLLRTLVEEPDRRALLSALFGIFAFIDVPLVFGSIRWWRTQHPQPI